MLAYLAVQMSPIEAFGVALADGRYCISGESTPVAWATAEDAAEAAEAIHESLPQASGAVADIPDTALSNPDLTAEALRDLHTAGVPVDDQATPMSFLTLATEQASNTETPTNLASPTAAVDTTTYVTPAGDPYLPPLIGGRPAVPLLRAFAADGAHVGLAGPPGSGKTTLALVAHGDRLIAQQFNGESTVEDVIGRHSPAPGKPGAFVWTDGPLARAMIEGRPYLATELSRAPQETQAVFLSVMDDQRVLRVESNPERPIIHAATGFAVIIDWNPGSGAGIIDALYSRLTVCADMPTDYTVADRLGVPGPLVDAARALDRENAVAVAEGGYHAAEWVPSLRDLLMARNLAGKFGLPFAAQALVSYCPDLLRRPRIADQLSMVLPDIVPAAGLTVTAAHAA